MTGRWTRTDPERQPSATNYQPPADPSAPPNDTHPAETSPDAHVGHGAHRLMMIACCIPMLIIVAILVATGVAGTGTILYALVCFGMMAAMMLMMPGGHHH